MKKQIAEKTEPNISRMPYSFVVTKKGKVVKQDVLNGYITSESKQLEKDVFADLKAYEQNDLIQPLYDPLSLANLLELNTYHMRACRTKAEDVAGNGWRLSPKVENANEKQKKKAEGFIDKQKVPIETTIKKLQLDKELTGYFGMEIIREYNAFDGAVDQIVHIPAHTIRIHESGNKYCQYRNNKKVWFRDFNYKEDIDYKTGEFKKAKSLSPEERGTEVRWSVNYTPRSFYYGIPDIVPAIGAITGDMSRRDYNIAFFSNYGIPAYLVTVTGDFDSGKTDPETGKNEVMKAIEEKFKEIVNNPQSIMVLTIPTSNNSVGGKVEIKIDPLSVEVKDASFRLYRSDNRDEIIGAHGMPPYRMGIYETGQLAGNLGRESTVIYYSSIIQPRQNVFNQIMNLDILPTLEITDWWFELESIDLTEIDKDVERSIKLILTGMMTPNQAIKYCGKFFGLEEVQDNPAMDFHYIQGKPIDSAGLIPESEITGALNGIKNKLIEGLIDYVSKNNNGNPDRDRRLTKAITDIEKDLRKTPKRGN